MNKLTAIIIIMIMPMMAQDITNKLGGDTANETYDITDSNDNQLFRVQGDGTVLVGTSSQNGDLEIDGDEVIRGDLYLRDSFYDKDAQAGTAGQILSSTGTATDWIDAPSGSAGNTLDQAYDQGGAGAGRTITADAGAFRVSGNDGVLFTGTLDSGSLPSVGSGPFMLWYAKKGAIKAGQGTAYDNSIGYYSVALGRYPTAEGIGSMAMGYNANALGDYSFSMGLGTDADSYGSVAVGQSNVGGGSPDTWVGTDPLFEIGNGIMAGVSAHKSNALIVYKNGNTEINGMLSIGTDDGSNDDDIRFDDGSEYLRWDNSERRFEFSDDIAVGTDDGTNDDYIRFDDGSEYLRWDDTSDEFVISDKLEIVGALSVAGVITNDDDYIYFDTGTDEYLRWDDSPGEFDFSDDVDISGELEANELWSKLGTSTFYKLTTTYGFSQEVYWTTSDRNMKKNIKPVNSPLEKLQLLNGVTYDWNDKAKDYFTKDIKENVRPDESLPESEKEAIWEEEKQKVLDEAERRKMSFIAQDVEEHFPEWVKENKDGIKEIDMKGLDAVLVEAIKELAIIVEQQGKRIADLEKQLSE